MKQDYVEKIEQFASGNPSALGVISKYVQILKSTKSPTKESKVSANGPGASTQESSSSDEEEVAEKDTESSIEVSGIKEYYESAKSKASDLYSSTVDSIADSYYDSIDFLSDKSDAFREFSSSPMSIGAVEILIEFFYLISYYTEFTTVGKSKLVPALIKDNLNKQFLKYPVLDLCNYFKFNVIAVFHLWGFITILAPLIVSYYINFTKTGKTYKATFDPYIFTLTKCLLVLFALKSEVTFSTVKDDVIYKIAGGSLLEGFKAFILEGDLQLRLLFGPTTLVANFVIASIALYAAAAK